MCSRDGCQGDGQISAGWLVSYVPGMLRDGLYRSVQIVLAPIASRIFTPSGKTYHSIDNGRKPFSDHIAAFLAHPQEVLGILPLELGLRNNSNHPRYSVGYVVAEKTGIEQ